jgi:hypothetical protein
MKPIRDEPIISESTQSVSAASKIPMDFDEFKRRYNELLNSYVGENKYYNELSFVKMWLSRYSKLSDLLQKTTKPEPLTPIEKRGLKALGTKNHYSNLEISFSLICKFLKQRRRQIKSELKSTLEPPQQNEVLNHNEVKKNKPDSKIPHIIMNAAILSIQSSLVEDKKTLQQSEGAKFDEVYKTQNLFKVGLLFATGEINKYFTITNQGKTIMKQGYSAPIISREFNNESYNKWILATINNYTTDNKNGNKNIFNSLDVMNKIIFHCEAKNIAIEPYFLSRLPIDKI